MKLLELDHDSILGESITQAGNVILGYFFFMNPGTFKLSPEILEQLEQMGMPEEVLKELPPLTAYDPVDYFQFDTLLQTHLSESNYQSYQPFILEASQRADWNYLPLEQKQYADTSIESLVLKNIRGKEFLDTTPIALAQAVEPNIPAIDQGRLNAGFLNTFPDTEDGVIRRVFTVMQYGNDLLPSWDIQILKHYWGASSVEVELKEDRMVGITIGDHYIHTDSDGSVLLNYKGPAKTIPTYSISDIIEQRIPVETLKGKIALVGITEVGIQDIYNTPVGNVYPGVEIHATFLENVFSSSYLRQYDKFENLLVWLLVGIGIALSLLVRHTNYLMMTLLSIGVLAGILGGVYYAYSQWYIWISFFYPSFLISGFWLVNTLHDFMEADREKRLARKKVEETKNVFQLFVPSQFMNRIARGGFETIEQGIAQQANVSILFSDIRSFTTISESMSHLGVFYFLNSYMRKMVPEIENQHGFIDKFIGDAIMAIFDEHTAHCAYGAEKAVLSAVGMRKALNQMNIIRQKNGEFSIGTGIGVNSGNVTMGTLGSETRMESTVIGDAVNLAARLEGLTKAYNAGILISQETYRRLENPAQFLIREVGYVAVKGKAKPTTIYDGL